LNDANPIYANVCKNSSPSSAEYSLRNGKIKPFILSRGPSLHGDCESVPRIRAYMGSKFLFVSLEEFCVNIFIFYYVL
jgi:hypothetical protein